MSTIPSSQAERLDPRITIPRPAVDPLLAPTLDAMTFPEKLDLNVLRSIFNGDEGTPYVFNAEVILKERPHLKHTEHSFPGPDGNAIVLSVFAPEHPTSDTLPAMYHIHGGGQVAGNRFTGLSAAMNHLDGTESVVVSVEYRLSPETRAPGAAEDCYAGLVWTSQHAKVLGIDPERIIVFGVSGGGPLAAVTCLMARDKQTPVIPIRGQMLSTPMLDDRCESLSDKQFEYGTLWTGVTNRMAWDCVLGDDRGTYAVTPYQAPARAIDLSALPPAYIDAGECEAFRNPAVFYALNMWRSGSRCELHVWPGAFHAFDMLGDSKLPIVRSSNAAKANWFRRTLGFEDTGPVTAVL